MKQGNFTDLAKAYANRPGYSDTVLQVLGKCTGALLPQGEAADNFKVADVGAGTGKLTEMLLGLGLNCVAVEPNQAMRTEGEKATREFEINWLEGTGEETGLESESLDWVLMASSFHWVDLERGLKEFYRILKARGYLTVMWNPRDLQRSKFHSELETKIAALVPELNRVSSGSSKYTQSINSDLVQKGWFEDCVFIEAEHELSMSKERYLGAWRSVNDIQAQAGPARFEEIMQLIESEISEMDQVVVPYKTRSWTVRKSEDLEC